MSTLQAILITLAYQALAWSLAWMLAVSQRKDEQ